MHRAIETLHAQEEGVLHSIYASLFKFAPRHVRSKVLNK